MLKLYPSWFVFFLLIFVGVFFVVSADNWFMSWMGFELALLGFIPMFVSGVMEIEGMIKYFLVQVAGSGMFIFSFLIDDGCLSGVIFLLSMVVKLGVFPFYQWVPSVMTSLSWLGCFLLASVQKIAPLFMMSVQSCDLFYFIVLLGGLSVVVSGVLGFNQVYMRSLMGYSSIAHTGWMVCVSVFSLKVLLLYFLFYSFVVGYLFYLFHLSCVLKVVSGSMSIDCVFYINILLLALSGLPPFIVFFFKIVVLYFLCFLPLVVCFLIFGSFLSVYYYLTFIIPSVLKFWLSSPVSKGFMFLVFSLFFSLSFPLFILL